MCTLAESVTPPQGKMGREFASASLFDVDAGLAEAGTRCEDMKGRVEKCTKLLLFMSASHGGPVMQSAGAKTAS